MARQKFNKLVRDRIPAIIRKDGQVPVTHTLSEEGFQEELRAKLVEEANEVREAPDRASLLEELADVEEVLRALKGAYAIDPADLERIRKQRVRKRGAFVNKTFLEYVKTD